MTHIYILYTLIAILAMSLLLTVRFVIKNKDGIEQNFTYIKRNKELINKNAQLIQVINMLISNSQFKAEWNRYKEQLRTLGICPD